MKNKKRLTTGLTSTLLGFMMLGQSAHAESPLEGQLIENVTFDCRGTINYLVKANSNNPAFVGHVQTIVDLPAAQGGGSWVMSGVLELGPDRGDNVSAKQQTAKIDRCFGQGDLQFGSCSTFSGVTRCAMQLDSTSFRMRIDRGSNGLFSTSGMGTELFSTSGMGNELYTTSAAGTE